MVTHKLLEQEFQRKVAKTGKTDISYDKIEHLIKGCFITQSCVRF